MGIVCCGLALPFLLLALRNRVYNERFLAIFRFPAPQQTEATPEPLAETSIAEPDE